MDKGKKVMDGSPAEVLTDPRAAGFGIAVPPVSKLFNPSSGTTGYC